MFVVHILDETPAVDVEVEVQFEISESQGGITMVEPFGQGHISTVWVVVIVIE